MTPPNVPMSVAAVDQYVRRLGQIEEELAVCRRALVIAEGLLEESVEMIARYRQATDHLVRLSDAV